MSNRETILGLVDELRIVVDEIENTVVDFCAKGVIVKALPDQTKFKTNSVWVGLGGGKFLHLTGKKGLIAKASNLLGYVKVVEL